MDLAKVMSDGQITIPINIRKKLNLKEGDKVAFIEKDGYIVLADSVMLALEQVQNAFQGEGERLNLKTEENVVNLVKEIRRESLEENKKNRFEKNYQYIDGILKKLDIELMYPIKNNSITVSTGNDRPVHMIRLARPQFLALAKRAVMIEMNDFIWQMSLLNLHKKLLFSKMFVTLEDIFGPNDEQGIGEGYKCSFCFPFLLRFSDERENLGYLMIVHDLRGAIDYEFAKIIPINENLDRSKRYSPFEDFTKEEIKYMIKNCYGYLEGWFEGYLEREYDSFFYKTVDSDLIVYGYKDGKFFDKSFDDQDEYNEFIKLISTSDEVKHERSERVD
ncbi:AbrB/MazE/SpoVT family DNA-binding domain-containing protein [Acetobacterium wieringae]|uniref:AbrB/MazE/SpoVT family DNA-binding domain-containing protein n=1 Tax=Acetobacterium wieringae TaxID=52694 RepID=A0ABY6HIF0_9FIRM|nr:AbrB/MazE/SpoVT family DNA-binding domain-containing protein [Acetobacterium wieringae]UYO63654.1 AbrB/MazE/SpoVT family DNA-binding domain-containing protein [Acetobacterium wieringae]